jgi:phosphoglycerate kinase
MDYKKITDEKNLSGKRVLLRLDLNVPVVGEEVRDDFRIQKSIPTLEFLRTAGAKTIIISHLENDLTDSLERVAAHLAKTIAIKAFITNLDDAPAVIAAMKDGEIAMIENVRKLSPGEKENDPVFAGRLASLADVYVNDAFAVSHREHASIVSIPRLIPSYAGPLLSREIEELSKAFNPDRPFLFILGGAKFETKLPLVEKFVNIADYIFVGGALANDIFKEKGFEVGRSLVAKKRINLWHIESSPKLIIPTDVIATGTLSKSVRSPEQVGPDESIMDVGPQTVSSLADLLSDVEFVLWNGPLGDYEKGYSEGTVGLARAIAASKAKSIVGGADTIAVIAKIGLLDSFGFVSTGGGAMLDFLAKGTLPGIEALKS